MPSLSYVITKHLFLFIFYLKSQLSPPTSLGSPWQRLSSTFHGLLFPMGSICPSFSSLHPPPQCEQSHLSKSHGCPSAPLFTLWAAPFSPEQARPHGMPWGFKAQSCLIALPSYWVALAGNSPEFRDAGHHTLMISCLLTCSPVSLCPCPASLFGLQSLSSKCPSFFKTSIPSCRLLQAGRLYHPLLHTHMTLCSYL